MNAVPIITFLLCASFLLFQHLSITKVSDTNEQLETEIAKVDGSGSPGSSGSKNPRRGGSGGKRSGKPGTSPEEGERQPLTLEELQEIADLAGKSRNSPIGFDMEAMIKIRKRLLDASPEELAEMIGLAPQLEASDRIKSDIFGGLVESLANHDPAKATRLAFESPLLNLDRHSWRYSRAFGRWAQESPKEAAAWLNEEMDKGSFESKALSSHSDSRLQFESAAIGGLLKGDPDAARERLLKVEEKDRLHILRNDHFFKHNAENGAQFAALVRETLPSEATAQDRLELLSRPAQAIVRKDGYSGVNRYVQEINATPDEAVQISRNAANRKFQQLGKENKEASSQDVAQLQTFLKEQAPDQVQTLTGEALGSFGDTGENFASALTLVEDLHTEAPNDDLLVGFLNSGIEQPNWSAARDLATKIQDLEQRERILQKLSKDESR